MPWRAFNYMKIILHNSIMNCNIDIHNEYKNMDYIICPFCDCKIQDLSPIDILCCENQKIINDGEKNVCLNCGIIECYNSVSEYINFHENKYKFYRKSIYHRKYHINNILSKYNLSVVNRNKVLLIFKEIGQILLLVNKDRKRMITLKYVLKQVFIMLDLDIDIEITTSKRTLRFYDDYWVDILLLKFDRIIKIIKQ